MKQQTDPGAYYDSDTPAVVIRSLAVNDPAVVAESRRWSAGQRGAAVGEQDMVGVDLSTFVSQALVVGAHATGTAGGVQAGHLQPRNGSSPTSVHAPPSRPPRLRRRSPR
ncbi:MAG: hypothetical protein WA731_04260 [Pseudonocardiaceae bacterium]